MGQPRSFSISFEKYLVVLFTPTISVGVPGTLKQKPSARRVFLFQYVIATELMSCPPAEAIFAQAGSGHKKNPERSGVFHFLFSPPFTLPPHYPRL